MKTDKPKRTRPRLFKTADYRMAIHLLAKKLLEAKPDITLPKLTIEEEANLPKHHKLAIDAISLAIFNAKF